MTPDPHSAVYRKRDDNDNWQVIYYVTSGTTRQRKFKSGFATRKAAQEWFKAKCAAPAVQPTTTTLADLIDRYLATRTHKQPGSIYLDKVSLTHFKSFLPAKITAADITPYHVESFLSARTKATSRHTSSRDQRTLLTFFNVAIKWGIITTNPAASIPKIKPDETEIVYLTPPEQSRLIEATHTIATSTDETPHIYPLVVIALRTGMRKQEILSLRWADIKPSHIDVVSRIDRRTKSGKSRRVPLDDMTRQVIDWWRQWPGQAADRARTTYHGMRLAARLEILSAQATSPYLFPSKTDTTQPMDNFTKTWYAARSKAKLNNRFHDLRHTFAVTCALSNVPIALLQRLLGHSDITTTQRYLRFYPDDAIERVKLPPITLPMTLTNDTPQSL